MSTSNFRIEKALGKGAFGAVYKVIRKSDNLPYAMKKINIRALSARELQDAVNEIRLMASLRHTNIIGYLESFVDGASLCIVMEFCDRGDLAGIIEKCKKTGSYLEEAKIWSYFIQICEGLHYLHDNHILHRDIKPANCFMTSDGGIKLGDFNVSKLVKNDGLVKTQIGTPYYMSPEIWKNRPYDSKCDIWSLGCILYEMASLRPPFVGNSMEELGRKIQCGIYPRIPSRYSQDMNKMIQQLLVTNPASRPPVALILKSPIIQKYKNVVPVHIEEDEVDLLHTIQVPRNIQRLTNDLPKPCYPDSRPMSPKAWPISEHRQEILRKEKQRMTPSLDPILEDIPQGHATPSLPPVAPPPRQEQQQLPPPQQQPKRDNRMYLHPSQQQQRQFPRHLYGDNSSVNNSEYDRQSYQQQQQPQPQQQPQGYDRYGNRNHHHHSYQDRPPMAPPAAQPVQQQRQRQQEEDAPIPKGQIARMLEKPTAFSPQRKPNNRNYDNYPPPKPKYDPPPAIPQQNLYGRAVATRNNRNQLYGRPSWWG